METLHNKVYLLEFYRFIDVFTHTQNPSKFNICYNSKLGSLVWYLTQCNSLFCDFFRLSVIALYSLINKGDKKAVASSYNKLSMLTDILLLQT